MWAKEMAHWLKELNKAVDEAGGVLNDEQAEPYRQQYRLLLEKAQEECPPPQRPPDKVMRGRLKRSKARNLLERLINYEADVLRFMVELSVPFTNNRGENDIRMTKVHQKISGCFRSLDGAKGFCRVRGYLSTCRKQGVMASVALWLCGSVALRLLFDQRLPDFCLAHSEDAE